MRLLLIVLLCLGVAPRELTAQAINDLRAGATRASRATAVDAPWHAPSATPAPRADGPCAYSRAERVAGGALLGGGLGAALGSVLSTLFIAWERDARHRAIWGGAAAGASIGAIWGASIDCRGARPKPSPPWDPRRRR